MSSTLFILSGLYETPVKHETRTTGMNRTKLKYNICDNVSF